MKFLNITIEDKKLFDSFLKPWQLEASDFSFANLFIWGVDGKIKYAVEDNALFVKYSFKGVPEFFLPPVPQFGESFDYKKLVDKAMDYLREQNMPPTIRSLFSPFKEMLEKACPDLILTPAPITSDYVYLSEALINLSGKKLHGKRNHINKFISNHPDYQYAELDESMYEMCMGLYREWSEAKEDEDLSDEKKSVKLALKNLKALGLTGGCILLDGVIEAFTVGERLNDDMHLIHIEKANADINGLYPMINQQYASRSCMDVTYINREEDMGIEGMRKAKHSYYPVKMVDKFIASEITLDKIPNLWGKDEAGEETAAKAPETVAVCSVCGK